jgi:hypothetical protein
LAFSGQGIPKNPEIKQALLPIDSTVIELTSKLFWEKKHYQVKLLTGINLEKGNTVEFLINFGQAHYVKGLINWLFQFVQYDRCKYTHIVFLVNFS